MKELSIEEKTYNGNYKVYIELINRLEDVKEAIEKQNYGIAMDILCHSYPDFQVITHSELEEGEDEEVRKELIDFFNEIHAADDFRGIPFKRVVAYLEKQGKQAEEILILKDQIESLHAAIKAIKETHKLELEKLKSAEWSEDTDVLRMIGLIETYLNSQKHYQNAYGVAQIDKCLKWLDGLKKIVQGLSRDDEPKFKVGDYVVSPNGVYWHIDAINNNRYEVSSIDGVCADWSFNTNLYRLWTIQDAKDGDVLACESGWTCIFKGLNHNSFGEILFDSHCFIDNTEWFCNGAKGHTLNERINGKINPATKEQRDLLFQKMKEAGYEWDAEKKELKKTEKAPQKFMVGDTIRYNGTEYKITEITPNGYKVYALTHDEDAASLISFSAPAILVEQKAEWSDEDEKIISDVVGFIRDGALPKDEKEYYIEKLLSLHPQSHWKPSEEMLEALYRAVPQNVKEISEDEILLGKLYQGLKYGRVLSNK